MKNIFNIETLACLSAIASLVPKVSAVPLASDSDVIQDYQKRDQVDRLVPRRIMDHSHQRIYNNEEDSEESINESIGWELARRAIEQSEMEKRNPVEEVEEVAPKRMIVKRTTRSIYYLSTYAADVASATAIHTPSILSASALGGAAHTATSKYIWMSKGPLPTLTPAQMSKQINPSLAEDFPFWNGSGYLNVNATTTPFIRSLNTKPSYSRDQTKGGNINGVNVFVYADTQCYTAPNGSTYGTFTGSTSNSAAMDLGLAPKYGKPVVLQEGIGAFAATNGNLRTFIPWTTAEEKYNQVMFGGGSRYAIWPESSFIPYDASSALLYTPVVFQNATGSGTTYTFAGTSLSKITISPNGGGPVATRIEPMLFPAGGVEWGCLGGLRTYGSSGVTGGNVYVFGNIKGGIAVARTTIGSVTDASSYQYYWPGKGWNSTAITPGSKGYFVSGGYSTVDMFYSPRHLTFIMVFQDIYIDNKIYWQYLKATKPIIPAYAGGDVNDIAQYITQYPWSSWILLMDLPAPGAYYTYGGGMHPGYFGSSDITRGGNKMLMTWTSPTGRNGASTSTGYSMGTAVAIWS